MIIGNRLVKTVFLTLGIFLIVINIVWWANDELASKTLIDMNLYDKGDFVLFHKSGVEFRGFQWFFDKLSTFPAFKFTYDVIITKWLNLAGDFDWTGVAFIDFIYAIFRVILAPFALLGTILVDLFNNLMWFFSFFF